MRQHPIPQDITNYKFHLIGSMTLKQFGELAGGCIVGLIIYSTNLIAIVKWPLILFVVGLSAMIAFVPIEERPLDHWIITFFKNIWKPTKFYWKRSSKVPQFFTHQIHQLENNQLVPDVDLNPARKKRIHEYLSSIKKGDEVDAWDQAENKRVSELLSGFDSIQVDSEDIEIEADEEEKPSLKTRVRKLKAPSRLHSEEEIEENPTENIVLAETQTSEVPIFEQNNSVATDNPEPDQTIDEPAIVENNPIQEEQITIEPNQVENAVTVETVTVPEQVEAEIPAEENKNEETPAVEAPSEEKKETFKSQLNKDLPLPTRPDVPNKLAGMIMNQAGEIIPGALVEVKNKDGQSSRIVKSNQFGQFFIKTPLENGKYQIHIEEANHQFEAFDLKLKGKIIPPIEIRSLA